jgi:hypothetical protein
LSRSEFRGRLGAGHGGETPSSLEPVLKTQRVTSVTGLGRQVTADGGSRIRSPGRVSSNTSRASADLF